MSLAGERQAWLAACGLQVPGSKARVLHRVMWDTGASINVVSDKIYRGLGSPNLSICQGTSVRTVTGTTQTVLGIVTLEVHVCACAHFLADFHVVDVPDTVLISFPQIRKLSATIGNIVRIPWKSILPTLALAAPVCDAVVTSASPSSGACVTQSPVCGPPLLATATRSSPSCDRLSAASAALFLPRSSGTSSDRDVTYSSRQFESIPNSELTSGTAPAGSLPAASSIAATMPIDQSNTVHSRSSPDVLTIAATPPISPISSEQFDVRNLELVKMPPRCERWIHADVPTGYQEFHPLTFASGLYLAKGVFDNGTTIYAESPPTRDERQMNTPRCSAYVLAMNPSYRPVQLCPYQRIGFVTPLTDEYTVAATDLFEFNEQMHVCQPIALLDVSDEDSELVPQATAKAVSPPKTLSKTLHDAIIAISEKSKLTLNQTKQLQDVLLKTKYLQLFSDGSTFPRPSKLSPAELPMNDSTPVTSKPYRVNPELSITIRDQLAQMVDQNVVQAHISSPYASPVLLVKKKTGDWRFCVDYRLLNAKLRNDVYPLPVINDVTDALNGATIFSHLDLASGYWQIPIAEKDRHKTAFILPNGLYQFSVLPFGISTAPSIFQRAMDFVLSGLKFEKCLVYLDDIIIYSKTFSQHLKDIEVVLDRLNSFDMTVKITKCEFAASSLEFLGHELDSEGIRPSASHVKDIRNWPRPETVSDVQKFLGLTGYFRKFVKNYSAIASDLHALTHGTRPVDQCGLGNQT